ncbi:MAG TPA: efflux RND transporter periplasmic adaptor subunit [Gemmatimonadales bacterium]
MQPAYPGIPLTFAIGLAGLILACGQNDTVPESAASEPAGGAITLWTDSTELFMEHPALIVDRPDKFAVHLTDLTDFAPLRSGRITLRFDPRGGGEPLVVSQNAPRAPGIYGPSPEFTRPGVYDLTIVVESPQARDTLRIPALRVYATVDEAPRETGEAPGGIGFLKEQQWKTAGFATAFATTDSVTETIQTTAAIVPAAGRMARVAAPVAGLIEASGVEDAPVPGQRVAQGQSLAVLSPALGEAGSTLSRAWAELREAEDEHARAKRLVEAEAAPARRLHEAQIRLTAARDALTGVQGSGSARPDGRLLLRAPIAGTIATRTLTPGSRVEAGTELFTIVDASVVWLQVNMPAAEALEVSRRSGASFRVAGGERVYSTSRMVSAGSIVDSISRTVPMLYQIENRDGSLKIGMYAQVAVGTGRRKVGVVIPGSAVLSEDGRSVAYVQVEGERFEKRELVLGAVGGHATLVLSGIRAGERVVTGAAYQVRLASLSTAVPAQGHEH